MSYNVSRAIFAFLVVQPSVRPLWSCRCGSVRLRCDVAAGVGVRCSSVSFLFHIHNLVVVNSRHLMKINKEVKKAYLSEAQDATVSSRHLSPAAPGPTAAIAAD